MFKQIVGTVLIAIAVPLAAQTPARTVQQDFQAAAALQDAKNYAAALVAWEALEKRVADRPRNLAIMRVRKSVALAALGRPDEALVAARAGLAQLPAGDATLQIDRFNATITIAALSERVLDYASAAAAYRAADKLAPTPGDHAGVFRGLVETETFVDPDLAMADMARAEVFFATLTLGKDAKAVLKRVKSQLLMNRGDFHGAQVEAGEAIELLGGLLTNRIDLQDVAARSNYAIAALLDGKPEVARRYMAYTGAGRLPTGSFDPGVQMKVPDCGGEAGLKPSDLAVVEFSVADDGTIAATAPVYAAGGGAVGLEFARAVRSWSFRPEQVKEMPAFFRYRARVELRCSAAFERPSISDYLDTELDRWLISKQVKPPLIAAGSEAATLPLLRAELARNEAQGAQSLALVPVLHALAKNRVLPGEESEQLTARALAILRANNAPAIALLAVDHLGWVENGDDRKPTADNHTVKAALRANAFPADPAAGAASRILLADMVHNDPKRVRDLLTQAASVAALAPNHPLRVGAWARLASLEQDEGNPEAARAAFEKSGLSAQQCALLDAPPRLKAVKGAFPEAALQWGFEGWTQVEYDIDASGTVRNERAIVSYPPFVFSKAGTETFRNAKYEKTFRPDGGLGCGGITNRVRFILPK